MQVVFLFVEFIYLYYNQNMVKFLLLLLGLGRVSYYFMVKNENFLGNGYDQGG